MANRIWRGDAVPIAQVVKITPATPEPGDTFTITINGKEVSFVSTDGTVHEIVQGLVAAWNSSTIPEVAKITAEAIDADDDNQYEYLTLTADEPGVPFKVSVSTTDAGGFQLAVATITEGNPGQNEIQRVSIPTSTGGGTFTLTFQGQTTAAIAYNANAATVQSALEGLSNIAAGDVIVTGASPTWHVEFTQAYAATNVPLMTGDGASLTSAASLTITTLSDGQPGQNQRYRFTSLDLNGVDSEPYFYLYFAFNNSLTAAIHIEADGPTLEAALEASVGAGNVVVWRTGSAGNWTWYVEFVGDLGSDNFGLGGLAIYEGTDIFSDFHRHTTVDQQGSASGSNEVQTVRLNGAPTGGTFTLSFQGQTTAAIAYNASAAAVEAALEALSNIDDVTVTLSGSTYTITFGGSLANTDLAQLTGNASGLTGGSVTVVTTQTSIAATNEVQQIGYSQTPGGGTFTLSWDPGTGIETPSNIAYNATGVEVQTALEGLATPTSGDFSVSGPAGGPWLVQFIGSYAGTAVNEISGDGSGLTGGGSQSLSLLTTQRSLGPNHFDDADNWTGGEVPHSQDSLFYNGGKSHCLYGLKQRVTFTADAGTDTLTFDELADFVEHQAVRLFTTDTLPAGLATSTTYYILNLDADAGTCQLSLTSGGGPIDLTDAGTGTHTIALHLAAIRFHSRWTGYLGLTERNDDYYEYLPRSLAVVVDTITIGEGEGDGQSRLDLDTGDQPTTLILHQSGGSNEAGLPAIRWKGSHANNSVVIHDGEFGAAVYATEEATIDSLVQHAGLVQMGIVTLGSLTKHGGELIAENATLAGALKLHA